jgi:hypothetical protein
MIPGFFAEESRDECIRLWRKEVEGSEEKGSRVRGEKEQKAEVQKAKRG